MKIHIQEPKFANPDLSSAVLPSCRPVHLLSRPADLVKVHEAVVSEDHGKLHLSDHEFCSQTNVKVAGVSKLSFCLIVLSNSIDILAFLCEFRRLEGQSAECV